MINEKCYGYKKQSIYKKGKKYKRIKNKNLIRNNLNYISDAIKKKGCKNAMISLYYFIIHFLILLTISFILLFNTNINHLLFALVIMTLDALTVIALHGCPLTLLEQKYLGISEFGMITRIVKKMGIFYKCEHEYEKQLEGIAIGWTLVALKILLILIFKTFNISLHNYYNIYKTI
jgi:hypothetical protein